MLKSTTFETSLVIFYGSSEAVNILDILLTARHDRKLLHRKTNEAYKVEPVRSSERRSYVGLYQKEEAAWVSNSIIGQNIEEKNIMMVVKCGPGRNICPLSFRLQSLSRHLPILGLIHISSFLYFTSMH